MRRICRATSTCFRNAGIRAILIRAFLLLDRLREIVRLHRHLHDLAEPLNLQRVGRSLQVSATGFGGSTGVPSGGSSNDGAFKNET